MRRAEAVTGAMVVVAFIAGVIESPYFLSVPYLLRSGADLAEGAFLALGMTFVIVAGQIDLSIASMMVLVAAISAKLLGAGCSPWLAVLFGLGLGATLGLVNGLLVAGLRLPSIMVTIATMAGYRGLTQAMLGAQSVVVPSRFVGLNRAPLLGVPLPLWLFAVAAVLAGLLLHRMVFGRWVFAVGTNLKAARFAAIPVERVTLLVFVLSGLCAGVGGLLIDSRLGVARYDLARGLELDVITAVVLGGASIYGGKGTILGTVLAVILVMFVRTGMLLANVTQEYQLAAMGSLLVVAVLIASGFERRGKGRRSAASV